MIPRRPGGTRSRIAGAAQAMTGRCDQCHGETGVYYLSSAYETRKAASTSRMAAQKACFEEIRDGRHPSAHLTGTWLTTHPSTRNGTELSADEFRDGVLLRYGDTPPHLPAKCDGCGVPFTVDHALHCSRGGLIIRRHNDIRDEFYHLCAIATQPSSCTVEPLIEENHFNTTS